MTDIAPSLQMIVVGLILLIGTGGLRRLPKAATLTVAGVALALMGLLSARFLMGFPLIVPIGPWGELAISAVGFGLCIAGFVSAVRYYGPNWQPGRGG